MFQRHAATRFTHPLLSGTQDTRSYFQTPGTPALLHVLFMSGIDISAACLSGDVTGLKISRFAQVHSSTNVMDYSIIQQGANRAQIT